MLDPDVVEARREDAPEEEAEEDAKEDAEAGKWPVVDDEEEVPDALEALNNDLSGFLIELMEFRLLCWTGSFV